jgi:hypothetical protein
VPPGHALLLMLGIIVAARLRDWVTWFVRSPQRFRCCWL